MKQQKILLKAALLFSLAMLVAFVRVQAADRSSQLVRVTIGIILASNQNDEFDAKLKPMEKQLKVLKYRSYRSLKNESQEVAWREKGVFQVPGGRSLTVAPQEIRRNRIALKVRLTEGQKPIIDTTVRIPNRGNFILGGPPHDGGVLVLSISAAAK